MEAQFNLTSLEAYRKLDNYKVIDNSLASNNKCLVCFSSNGLYYPNTNQSLDKVVRDEKYEWKKIINNDFKRIIYIRDIYKQWYVKGINSECNTVEKVKVLLLTLTDGYDCTFIGSSAGGYAAVLFGDLVNANKIISFSGQFDISLASKCKKKNVIIHEASNTEYFDVSKTKANVYYFFPVGSDIDRIQNELIKGNAYVKVIEVNHSFHGVPLYPFALNKIISSSSVKLDRLVGRVHNKLFLSIIFMSFFDFLKYIKIKINSLVVRYRLMSLFAGSKN